MSGTYIFDTWFVPETDIVPSDAVYNDGTYEGVGMGIGYGYGDDIPVTVVIEGGKIADIQVGNHNETPNLGGAAIKYLVPRVIEANGVDCEGIDAVGSATISSNGFFTAVREALAQAQ